MKEENARGLVPGNYIPFPGCRPADEGVGPIGGGAVDTDTVAEIAKSHHPAGIGPDVVALYHVVAACVPVDSDAVTAEPVDHQSLHGVAGSGDGEAVRSSSGVRAI